jgi:hypothetical protein
MITLIASELKDDISTESEICSDERVYREMMYPPSCSKASLASFFVGLSNHNAGHVLPYSTGCGGAWAAALGLIITTKSAFHCLKLSVSGFGRAHFGTCTKYPYCDSLSCCNFILDQIDNLAHSQVAHFYKTYVDHFSLNPVLTNFFNNGIPKGFIILLACLVRYHTYFINIFPFIIIISMFSCFSEKLKR